MSSVTTSTTVCAAADQPWSGTVGVNTRTRAVPWGRVWACLKWLASAPYRSTSLRSTTSSGATCRKYAVSSPAAASGGGPPVPSRARGEVGRLREQIGLVVLERGGHALTLARVRAGGQHRP